MLTAYGEMLKGEQSRALNHGELRMEGKVDLDGWKSCD